MILTRRHALAITLLPVLHTRAARATPEALATAISSFVGRGRLQTGRVTIELAELVENGNTVPLGLSVQSPMTPTDHVHSLAVFTERNPQPDVAVFYFSPWSGRARVDTRVRLATSQRVVAVAKMNDGNCWQREFDVIVTLAACVES